MKEQLEKSQTELTFETLTGLYIPKSKKQKEPTLPESTKWIPFDFSTLLKEL